jgi:single-strand DNA-binding protein
LNNLNSFLIEGAATGKPVKHLNGTATFAMSSQRFFNHDGEKKSEVSFFDIEVYGKTAELCVKNIEKGRGLRVVGRVRCLDGKKWVVVGESVEFKPKFDKRPGEVAAE